MPEVHLHPLRAEAVLDQRRVLVGGKKVDLADES